jgi:hypothetical protein
MFICLSVLLFSFHLSAHPSILQSVFPSVCPSICLSVCLSVCPSIRLSVCLSVCLSFHQSILPSVCPSLCLSVRPFICLSVRLPSVALSLSQDRFENVSVCLKATVPASAHHYWLFLQCATSASPRRRSPLRGTRSATCWCQRHKTFSSDEAQNKLERLSG